MLASWESAANAYGSVANASDCRARKNKPSDLTSFFIAMGFGPRLYTLKSTLFVIAITDKFIKPQSVTDTHLPTALEILSNTVPVSNSHIFEIKT